MKIFDTISQRKAVIIVACCCLPICLLLAIVLGSSPLSLTTVWSSLFTSENSGNSTLIIQQIRIPRALLAALIGAILGINGAAMQGLFRNPLADPSLIGVTAGASAGASLMIFFASTVTSFTGFSGLLGLSLVSIGAFLGGIFSVLLVYQLATNRIGTSVSTMLLAGIAITAIVSGLSSLLAYFADNEMLRRMSLWQMGGLAGANYQRVTIVAVVCLALISLLTRYSMALNALLLGESEARHLGISIQKVKLNLILLVSASVGTAVALSGTIAFVGLVVPHIMRLLIGPDHRYLLPMSAIGGALLLLLADIFARTAFAPTELPVGVVTALLGAPFFISLLHRRHDFGMR